MYLMNRSSFHHYFKYTNPAYRHSSLLQAKVGGPSLGTHLAIKKLSIYNMVTE